MPKFVVNYSTDVPQPEGLDDDDARLYSAAYERNLSPIKVVIDPIIKRAASQGAPNRLLEIGSGTGQHALSIAEAHPDWTVQPTDPNPRHVQSMDAWRRKAGAQNLSEPLQLDITRNPMALLDARHSAAQQKTWGVIVCINVLHIAPWPVTSALLATAGALLEESGALLIYGPFQRGTQALEPSNAEFDSDLRAENARWGIRNTSDIASVAADHGLALTDTFQMPANNLVLVVRPITQSLQS